MASVMHRVKFWWKTRHWNRRHFPGCPMRYYGTGICVSPEFLCAPERTTASEEESS